MDINELRRLMMSAGDSMPAVFNKVKNALNPTVVGELETLAVKQAKPDILTQAIQKSPLMIEQATESIVPQITNNMSSIADDVVSKAAGLSNAQKLGAGLTIGAGAATLMRDGGNQPPVDTTKFIAGPESSEIEGNELVNNQVVKQPEAKSVSTGLVSNKAPMVSPNINVAPQQIPQPVDDFNDRLARAEDTDNKNNLLFGLLKAAQMGGSALAGTKADTSYADEQLKNPNQAVGHLESRSKLMDENTKRLEKAKLNDPNSDISKQSMAMLASVYPDLAAKYPNLSAAQLETMGMNLGQLATTKENAKSRELTAKMHADTLLNSRQDRLDKDSDTKLDKRKKITEEVENFRSNIKDNVERARQLVSKTGTFELLGSEQELLSGIMDEIATDMAKLQDPTSIARPKEVELVRKNLVPDTKLGQLGMSNKTALQLLDSFEQRIDNRANNAYKVRGVGLPSYREENSTTISKQFGADVLNYAKTHNITPEQAQTIKNRREGK